MSGAMLMASTSSLTSFALGDGANNQKEENGNQSENDIKEFVVYKLIKNFIRYLVNEVKVPIEKIRAIFSKALEEVTQEVGGSKKEEGTSSSGIVNKEEKANDNDTTKEKKDTELSIEILIKNFAEEIKNTKKDLEDAVKMRKEIEQEYKNLQERDRNIIQQRNEIVKKYSDLEKRGENSKEEPVKEIFLNKGIFDRLNEVIVKSKYIALLKRLEQLELTNKQSTEIYRETEEELSKMKTEHKNIDFSFSIDYIANFRDAVLEGKLFTNEELETIRNSGLKDAREFCDALCKFGIICNSNKYIAANDEYNDNPKSAIFVVQTIQNLCKDLVSYYNSIMKSLEERLEEEKTGFGDLERVKKTSPELLEQRYRLLGEDRNDKIEKAKRLQKDYSEYDHKIDLLKEKYYDYTRCNPYRFCRYIVGKYGRGSKEDVFVKDWSRRHTEKPLKQYLDNVKSDLTKEGYFLSVGDMSKLTN